MAHQSGIYVSQPHPVLYLPLNTMTSILICRAVPGSGKQTCFCPDFINPAHWLGSQSDAIDWGSGAGKVIPQIIWEIKPRSGTFNFPDTS